MRETQRVIFEMEFREFGIRDEKFINYRTDAVWKYAERRFIGGNSEQHTIQYAWGLLNFPKIARTVNNIGNISRKTGGLINEKSKQDTELMQMSSLVLILETLPKSVVDI